MQKSIATTTLHHPDALIRNETISSVNILKIRPVSVNIITASLHFRDVRQLMFQPLNSSLNETYNLLLEIK